MDYYDDSFAAQAHVRCPPGALFLQAICLAYEAVGRPDSVPTVTHLLQAAFAYSNLYPRVAGGIARKREIKNDKRHRASERETQRERLFLPLNPSFIYFFWYIWVCRKLQMSQRDLLRNDNSSAAHRLQCISLGMTARACETQGDCTASWEKKNKKAPFLLHTKWICEGEDLHYIM